MGRPVHRHVFACVVLPLALSACASISASVNSVSNSVEKGLDSVSDSFGSVSGSSGTSGGDAKAAALYRADLRACTLARLDPPAAGRTMEHGDEGLEFVREIARIAELHGITDWEGDVNTGLALREAIASGGVDAAGVARLRRELAPLGPQWVDAVLSVPAAPVAGDAPATQDAGR